MGDRVFAYMEIGGHLETIEQAERLVDALVQEGVDDRTSGRHITDEALAMSIMRKAVEEQDQISVEGQDVNYGSFDRLEEFICSSPHLASSTCFGAGEGFSEGRREIRHVDGEKQDHLLPTNEGTTCIPVRLLKEAMSSDDPLAAIGKLIDDSSFGDALPPLTASPAVAAWLKIFANKAA